MKEKLKRIQSRNAKAESVKNELADDSLSKISKKRGSMSEGLYQPSPVNS